MVTIDDDTPLYVSIDHHHGLCLEARYDELKNGSAPWWQLEALDLQQFIQKNASN